jgi:CheY-like chemotaxis protein
MIEKNYKEVSIVLVEDDEVDAKSVERALTKLKIANPYYHTRNGLEALELLKGSKTQSALAKPYLVLLDLNMPLMGGIEFLQALRNDSDIEDTIVFVLTTSSADEDRVAAYKEHIAGYIVKSDMANGFTDVIEMLDSYWRIVVFPE